MIHLYAMKISKTNLILISAVVLIILTCVFGLPFFKVLSISNRKKPSEHYLSTQGLKNGFVISYTHSVNKGRVHDFYLCQNDDTLLLDHTTFVSYGAGIPEPDETPGAIFTVTPNGYTISNLKRVLPRFVMAVGIIANHSIVFDYNNDFSKNNNSEIMLSDLFAPQTSILFEIKRVSLIDYIFNKI